MGLVLGLVVVYIMGFFSAIPIGATQIEIAKRSLSGNIRAALMIVLGSALSDMMYGFIAYYGIAPLLKEKVVMAVFWAAGSVILFVLGAHTLKNYKKAIQFNGDSKIIKHRGLSFVVGFSLAVTNPFMIFWWITVADIGQQIGLISNFSGSTYFLLILFGGLGLASYLTTLSFTLQWAKKFISDKTERRINLFLGITLILFGFYFLFRFLGAYGFLGSVA